MMRLTEVEYDALQKTQKAVEDVISIAKDKQLRDSYVGRLARLDQLDAHLRDALGKPGESWN